MATNPYFTQYHTQRFSFIGSPQQRDGTSSHDQRFLNMYPELIKSPISDGKKYYLKKRPGIDTPTFTVTAGIAQGLFYWPTTGDTYFAVGGNLYRNGAFMLTLSQSTNPIGIAEFKTDAADKLFICDGIRGWMVTTAGAATQITDANFPNPHVAQPVFLDGYLFLAGLNTQTIHNSTLNDPTTWPADGFIDAEMYPDALVGLAKVQNYLAAVGAASIEWFYDNANATGSPLQRNAPAVSQFGCPAPWSINQTEKELILIGTTNNGGRTIWILDGFQPTEIANEPVREALDKESTTLNAARAFTIQVNGHKFYVVSLITQERTFVYDFEEQMWHEWSSGIGQNHFNWHFASDGPNGYPMILSANQGTVNGLSANLYSDNGSDINCLITTTKLDFDTMKRKRFYRLSIVGDAPNGDTNVTMQVAWSDDDYTVFNTPVNLNMNATYPTITQLGYARRRAFQFIFRHPLPLRLEAFEVDIVQEVRR